MNPTVSAVVISDLLTFNFAKMLSVRENWELWRRQAAKNVFTIH